MSADNERDNDAISGGAEPWPCGCVYRRFACERHLAFARMEAAQPMVRSMYYGFRDEIDPDVPEVIGRMNRWDRISLTLWYWCLRVAVAVRLIPDPLPHDQGQGKPDEGT